MKKGETSELILVDIHISRMYSDVLSSLFGHHIERGCENILPLSTDIIMVAYDHHGSRLKLHQEKREQQHHNLE